MSNSNAVNRLLSKGNKPASKPTDYRSFLDNGGGRPQMGFAITRANGDADGFLYHNLDNLNLQTRNGAEFLTFTSRGKAVTIQGTGLQVIFRAMVNQSLMEINEPDGRPAADPAMPTITRMEITTVGRGESVVRLAG